MEVNWNTAEFFDSRLARIACDLNQAVLDGKIKDKKDRVDKYSFRCMDLILKYPALWHLAIDGKLYENPLWELVKACASGKTKDELIETGKNTSCDLIINKTD